MSQIVELINKLRERTGAGILDCKKALLANDNDLEKSVIWLREKGIAKQARRAERIAAEGVAWAVTNGNKAAIVELNCETDFVANSDPFRDLVKIVCNAVVANDPKTNEEVLALPAADGKTINDLFVDAGIKLGEKLALRRFAVVTKKDGEEFGKYIHMNGKIAAVSVVTGNDAELANNMAICVCSYNPVYVTPKEIPQEKLDSEMEIEKEAAKNDPKFDKKPANIQAQILEGRVKKNLYQLVLTEQPFVFDESKTVGQVLVENKAEVVSYVRFAVGEGIEKKKDNFAEEVASQLK